MKFIYIVTEVQQSQYLKTKYVTAKSSILHYTVTWLVFKYWNSYTTDKHNEDFQELYTSLISLTMPCLNFVCPSEHTVGGEVITVGLFINHHMKVKF